MNLNDITIAELTDYSKASVRGYAVDNSGTATDKWFDVGKFGHHFQELGIFQNPLKFDYNYTLSSVAAYDMASGDLTLNLEAVHTPLIGKENIFRIIGNGVNSINIGTGFDSNSIFPTNLDGYVLAVGTYLVKTWYDVNGVGIIVNALTTEASISQATESVIGGAKIGTQGIVDGGLNDTDFVTSLKLRSTTFVASQIPNLAAEKISSGTFADARIPNLAASKIDSGTFAIDRIPTGTSATEVALGNHTHPSIYGETATDESTKITVLVATGSTKICEMISFTNSSSYLININIYIYSAIDISYSNNQTLATLATEIRPRSNRLVSGTYQDASGDNQAVQLNVLTTGNITLNAPNGITVKANAYITINDSYIKF